MSRPSKIWKRRGRGFWTTRHGRQIYLGSDLKEAKREFTALMKRDRPSLPGRFSVAQLVDLFIQDCQRRVDDGELSPATLKTHRAFLLRWAEACRRIRPEDLRVYHLDAWIAAHAWNSTTRANAVKRVKIWSRWLRRKGYLETNYLSDAQPPQALKREAADPADLLKLEQAIDDEHFLDWFRVAYDTGCRPGELCQLSADDVDWNHSTAIVIGKSGRRVIGLSERALGILKRCRAANPDGPLLTTFSGVAWSQWNIARYWNRYRERAALPVDVVPYSLRHALYSRWHSAGISDVTVARQLGHSTRGIPHLELLVSTYSHTSGETLAAAARSASNKPNRRRAT